MPPKSVKKELKSLWHSCESCEVKVNQNKLKTHEKQCGKLSFGVVDSKFITPSITLSLPNEINDKDAPATYLQRFLFVPESISSFCNFTMGCNLLIEAGGGEKYVRTSWTIHDKHMDEVFSSSEGK